MGRRLPRSMKVVMCQLLVLLIGACVGEASEDAPGTGRPSNTAGNASAGTSCQPGFDCNTSCRTNADCDTELGRVCGAFRVTNTGSVKDDPTRRDLPALGDDAGPETDSDTDAGSTHKPPTGHCTSTCDTLACPDGMVCSATGACKYGCDHDRRESCSESEFCNFEQRKCFPREGTCKTEADCPRFEKSLMERGTLSCISERCRFEPTFGMESAHKLASPIQNNGLLPITVHQPSMGLRITSMEAFTFQFSVPASVMVVTILQKSDFKDLRDAADASLWTAYLDKSKARAGIRISDGGAVRNGEWFAEAPDLPLDRPLYFLALGYDEGRLVAESAVVPFMIGKPLPQPGDVCPSVLEGEFCGEGSALFCIDGTCRTPCFSDEDCLGEEPLGCLPLGVYDVSARRMWMTSLHDIARTLPSGRANI